MPSGPPRRRTRAGGGGRSSTPAPSRRRSGRTPPPPRRAARGARPGAAGRRARPRAPASRRPRARRRPRTPPRAGGCGARRASARGPTGSRRAPGAGRRSRACPTARRGRRPGRPGARYSVSVRSSAVSSPTVIPSGSPRSADRVVRGVQAAQQLDPVGAVPVAPGQAIGRRRDRARLQPPRGDDQQRDRGLDRGRDEALGHDDRDARRRVQAPAEAGLGEECVQHRPAALARVSSRRCRRR